MGGISYDDELAFGPGWDGIAVEKAPTLNLGGFVVGVLVCLLGL